VSATISMSQAMSSFFSALTDLLPTVHAEETAKTEVAHAAPEEEEDDAKAEEEGGDASEDKEEEEEEEEPEDVSLHGIARSLLKCERRSLCEQSELVLVSRVFGQHLLCYEHLLTIICILLLELQTAPAIREGI
jgi:hypothetical protein